jgi:ATP-binding cassette, subfamily C (CFTR/MRP), member 1
MTAKRAPYADHIIALDEKGKIAEQGRFDDLNSTGGYVSTFSLPTPEWDYRPEEDVTSSTQNYPFIPPNPNQVTDNLEAEANRRTGDVSIYLYYIRSIGWWPTIIFIVAITAFIFCISFPSEYMHQKGSDRGQAGC